MPDYQKMYVYLAATVSDVLETMEVCDKAVSKKFLQEALWATEDYYIRDGQGPVRPLDEQELAAYRENREA